MLGGLSARAAVQMAMHLSPHNFEHAEVRCKWESISFYAQLPYAG